MNAKLRLSNFAPRVIDVPNGDVAGFTDAIRHVLTGEALVATTSADAQMTNSAALAARHAVLSPYAVESWFLRGAVPLFESLNDTNLNRYFAEGAVAEASFTQAMSPLPSPGQYLASVLNAAWPKGARPLRLLGHSCPFGLVRQIIPPGGVEFHVDRPHLDRPDLLAFRQPYNNLAVVWHLDPPDGGGELQVCSRRFDTTCEIDAARVRGHPYALRADLLPPPVTVPPRAGLITIFDAANAHRVLPATGVRPRVTLSGFALFTGYAKPLDLYY